jgi:hypothetical protein
MGRCQGYVYIAPLEHIFNTEPMPHFPSNIIELAKKCVQTTPLQPQQSGKQEFGPWALDADHHLIISNYPFGRNFWLVNLVSVEEYPKEYMLHQEVYSEISLRLGKGQDVFYGIPERNSRMLLPVPDSFRYQYGLLD